MIDENEYANDDYNDSDDDVDSMNNFEDSENSTDEHENDLKNLEDEKDAIINSLLFDQSKDNELVKTDLSSRKKSDNAVKFNSAALISESSSNSSIEKFKKIS